MQVDQVRLDTQVNDVEISSITVQGLYKFLTKNIVNGHLFKSIAALNGNIEDIHTIQAALDVIDSFYLAVKVRPLKSPSIYFKVMPHNLPLMDADESIAHVIASFKCNYYHFNRMIISTTAYEALERYASELKTSKIEIKFENGNVGKFKSDHSKKNIFSNIMEKMLVIPSESDDDEPFSKKGSVEWV